MSPCHLLCTTRLSAEVKLYTFAVLRPVVVPGLVCIVGVGAAAPWVCCACAWPTEVVLLKKNVSSTHTFTSFVQEKKKKSLLILRLVKLS